MSSVKVPSATLPAVEESSIASKLNILKEHPYVVAVIVVIVCFLIYYFYVYNGGVEGLKKKKSKKKKEKDSDDEEEDNEKAEGEEIDSLIKGINKKQKSDDDE
jgi:amino acid permease